MTPTFSLKLKKKRKKNLTYMRRTLNNKQKIKHSSANMMVEHLMLWYIRKKHLML